MNGRVLVTGWLGPSSERLRLALDARGYATVLADAGELETGQPQSFDVVLAGGADPLSTLQKAGGYAPRSSVVVVDPTPSMSRTIAALRAGAADYLTDTADVDAVDAALTRILERRSMRERLGHLGDEPDQGGEVETLLLGDSPAIRSVREKLERLRNSDATVLVSGESGTGKEVVARALHRTGVRRQGPFVAVSCAALPTHLVESELFGHTRGAFTSAARSRPGLFLEATGGSLFLDEIASMPLSSQSKLLRAIQERTVRPLGQGSEIRFDARILAATNVDLQKEVARGRFRNDLYFRLNVVQIALPPLRERGDDTLILAQHFVRRFAKSSGKHVLGMTPGAARALLAHDWPGNVRELSNRIEAAVALAGRDHITERDISPHLGGPLRQTDPEPELTSLGSVEAQHIAGVLDQVRGNKAQAARLLGIDRKTLYRKLRRHGLERYTPAGDDGDEPAPPAGKSSGPV